MSRKEKRRDETKREETRRDQTRHREGFDKFIHIFKLFMYIRAIAIMPKIV